MRREIEIPREKYFYACDGNIIRNMEELFEFLQDVPEHTFRHHVNEEKNDFHRWVKDVVQNHSLALNLKTCRTQDDMLRYVFISLFG